MDIPFGRIHEPKNWSPHLAPKGKTHIVAEYFCFANDEIWNSSDQELFDMTADHLVALGFIQKEDVVDGCVLRKLKAYPLFEVGYQEKVEVVTRYLDKFCNLHCVGRSGNFKYLNMDHAMESGIAAAHKIIASSEDQS